MEITQELIDGAIPPDVLFELADNMPRFEDTWSGSKYWYGRITMGRGPSLAAIPEMSYIDQFPLNLTKGKPVSGFTFVIAALVDMYERYDELVRLGRLPSGMFTVVTGYSNPEDDYEGYVEDNVYPVLSEYIRTHAVAGKIRDTKSFIEQLGYFIDNMSNLLPMSLSSYIGSRFYDPTDSGLVINLRFNRKYKREDAEHQVFSKLAKSYGFFVDPNVTNRLFADIRNPSMLKYMVVAGIDVSDDNMMFQFFRPVHGEETSRFMGVIEMLYNLYSEELEEQLPPWHMPPLPRQIELYHFTRAKEYGARYSQSAWQAVNMAILSAYEQFNMQVAVQQIENRYPIGAQRIDNDAEPTVATFGLVTETIGTFQLTA